MMLMILARPLGAGTPSQRLWRPFRLFFLPHLLGLIDSPALTPGNHRARLSTPGLIQIIIQQAHISTTLFRLVTQTANLLTMAISRRRVTCRPGREQSTWSSTLTPGPAVWQLAKPPSGSDMPLLFLLAPQ